VENGGCGELSLKRVMEKTMGIFEKTVMEDAGEPCVKLSLLKALVEATADLIFTKTGDAQKVYEAMKEIGYNAGEAVYIHFLASSKLQIQTPEDAILELNMMLNELMDNQGFTDYTVSREKRTGEEETPTSFYSTMYYEGGSPLCRGVKPPNRKMRLCGFLAGILEWIQHVEAIEWGAPVENISLNEENCVGAGDPKCIFSLAVKGIKQWKIYKKQ
jgi:hypothetical protein